MTMRAEHSRIIAAVVLLLGVSAVPRPATAQDAALVTTIGNDTLCFERYTRRGNVVTGSWVVMHPPGVYVHDYRLTLGADGLPVHYSMKYSEPLADPQPAFDSVVVDYGRDTVTYTFTDRDSTITRKVALHEALPFLGQSMLGVDLALRRLRAAHADLGVVTAAETSNLVTPPRQLSVRLAGDSAFVGRMRIRVAQDGGFVDMYDGRLVVHPDPSLDVAKLTKHFVDAYAPRVAALKAAAAARREIPLAAAQLDRFGGSYGRGAISVAREGEHLVLVLPSKAKFTLLAMSQSEFFVRQPDLVVTFDIDTTGAVRGMTVAQGENKQHLPRDN